MEGRGAGKIGGAAGPDSRGWAGLKLVGASASRWGGARAGRGGAGAGGYVGKMALCALRNAVRGAAALPRL